MRPNVAARTTRTAPTRSTFVLGLEEEHTTVTSAPALAAIPSLSRRTVCSMPPKTGGS